MEFMYYYTISGVFGLVWKKYCAYVIMPIVRQEERLELVKNGKTKDVYKLPCGNYLFKFKDTVTGHVNGAADPGGNQVVGTVKGVGSGALMVSAYYFELLKKQNIPTHFVSADVSKDEMIVRPALFFGNGLEFVVRYKAAGSFLKRFGQYCKEGEDLPGIFEVTLKDDDRNDPPVTSDILFALKILTPAEYEKIYCETIKICCIIKDDLKLRGLELVDIKIEFGIVDGDIALIDEISAGNMRVYKDGVKLDYLELSELISRRL